MPRDPLAELDIELAERAGDLGNIATFEDGDFSPAPTADERAAAIVRLDEIERVRAIIDRMTPRREVRGDPSGWGGTCGWCNSSGMPPQQVSCWRCGLWSGVEYEVRPAKPPAG